MCFLTADGKDTCVSNYSDFIFSSGREWSKIIFCVWLAFAVKIVVVMTTELNLAWFTRYEPRKLDGDDVTAVSLTRQRAMLYLTVSSPKVFRAA